MYTFFQNKLYSHKFFICKNEEAQNCVLNVKYKKVKSALYNLI